MSTETRSFTGKDIKHAFAAVRAELGDDVVIVASETAGDGSCVVYAEFEQPDEIDSEIPGAFPSVDERYRSLFVERVRRAGPVSAHSGTQLSAPQLHAALLAERTPDRLAGSLAEDARRAGLADAALALARAIDGQMILSPLDLRNAPAIFLCGPHGAGKTTVAAKLAAQAMAEGRNVRLVATDTAGAGALARLQAFADGLGADIDAALNGAELAQAIADARETNTLIIADSRGFDPRTPSAWREFLEYAKAGAEVVAVLSACGDAEESSEMLLALKELGATRLIVTATDAVRRRGTLLALCTSGLPVAQISASPFVAGGVYCITPVALARDIVAHATANLAGSAAA